MASERIRAAAQAQKVAAYTAKLIDGPMLQVPLEHMKIQFNPTNLVALCDAGTIYPTIHDPC